MMSIWKKAGISMKDFEHVLKKELKELPAELGTEATGLKAFNLNRVTEMEPEFLNGDEEHVHDQRVSSIGFVLEANQQIELFKLQDWISTLIRDFNQDLFRYKGVIAVKGREKKFVFQGVHMLFGGDFAAER